MLGVCSVPVGAGCYKVISAFLPRAVGCSDTVSSFLRLTVPTQPSAAFWQHTAGCVAPRSGLCVTGCRRHLVPLASICVLESEEAGASGGAVAGSLRLVQTFVAEKVNRSCRRVRSVTQGQSTPSMSEMSASILLAADRAAKGLGTYLAGTELGFTWDSRLEPAHTSAVKLSLGLDLSTSSHTLALIQQLGTMPCGPGIQNSSSAKASTRSSFE